MRKWMFCVVCVVLAGVDTVYAMERIAILEFRNRSQISEEYAFDFSDTVRGVAVQVLNPQRFLVVTRESIELLLKEEGINLADCDAECEVEIGRKIKVQYVVSGDIMTWEDKNKVTLKLHETKSARVLSIESSKGKGLEELEEGIKKAAQNLLKPLMDQKFADGSPPVVPPPSPKPQEDTVSPPSAKTSNPVLEVNAPPTPTPPQLPSKDNLVLIPKGCFMMGASGNSPGHKVCVDAFYMSKREVTVSEYRACVKARACTVPDTGGSCNWGVSGRENHPINCVDWQQAQDYCTWKGGRLPTEAEWEYAVRAGTNPKIRYSFGDDESELDQYAWYDKNSKGSTHPVAQLKPNDWGLYDMHGNVSEWVEDIYDDSYYSKSPVDNPVNTASGVGRVIRGGGWFNYGQASYLHSTHRGSGAPASRGFSVGFRCRRSP